MDVQFREFRDKAKRNRVAVEGRIDHIQRFVVEHVHLLSVTYIKSIARIVYSNLPPSEQSRLRKHGWNLSGAEPVEEVVEVPEHDIDNGDTVMNVVKTLLAEGRTELAAELIMSFRGKPTPQSQASKLQKRKTG